MEENSEFDKKSLKLITGKSADWDSLALDCVAFANSKGGEIHIGIEDDEDCPPPSQKINDSLIEKISKTIPQRTVGVGIAPSIRTSTNGGEYISLKVFRSSQVIASTSNGRYYYRIADESKPIPPEDLTRIAAEKQAFVWEEKVVRKISSTQVDILKYQFFMDDIKSSDRVSSFIKGKNMEEIMDFYFMSKDGHLTNLGILWLGKREDRANMHYAPSVQFIKYDDSENKINKIMWDDFELNPKELASEIINLSDWKESIEISDGLFRRNIPHYDIEVIRELIVNALVHRVYTMRGDIFINLYHDRLEIHSPGPLPLGVTPQNIISKSIHRNTHLAKVFYDLNLMEKEGSGYDKVYELLLFNGKPEPKVEEYDDRVVVTIKKNIISKEVVKLMSKVNSEYNLKQKETIALGIIAQNNSISSIELSKKLSLHDDDTSLRSWLDALLRHDIILSKGRTKATEYYINPILLKQLDFKGKTDLKKIEPHRLAQLIVEDLNTYQPTSIGDIQKRIGEEINYKRIKRQLDKMIDDGKVESIGKKRWTKYKLSREK